MTNDNDSSAEEISTVITANTRLHKTIASFEINIKKSNKAKITKGFLEARDKLIQEYWQQFQKDHNIIMENIDESDPVEYLQNDIYQLTEDAFLNIRTWINDKMNEVNPPPANFDQSFAILAQSNNRRFSANADQTDNTVDFRLPRIDLPKFNGSYNSWSSFYELFKATVHDNNKIPSVQKLHFLKSCLTDEAAHFLKHFQLTELNYNPAWEMLVNRYENKRILVNTQLKILVEQPKIQNENAFLIKRLLDTTTECLHSLRNLGLPTNTWDAIIIYLLVQKMSPETHLLWEQSIATVNELPNWLQFSTFLETRFQTLEVMENCKQKSSSNVTKSSSKACHAVLTKNCVLCSASHSIRECDQFKRMSVADRQKLKTEKNLCTNCLSDGHHSAKCKSNKRCTECKGRHHSLLHYATAVTTTTPTTAASSSASGTENSSSTNINSFHSRNMSGQVLLATVLIKINGTKGDIFARALLDQGSQTSFMTEKLAKKLQVKKTGMAATITGIGQNDLAIQHQVNVTINAHFETKANVNINALLLPSLISLLPSEKFDATNWQHVDGLVLADPKYNQPENIDMLLGADVYANILLDGVRRGEVNQPIAQKTKLGWILSGSVQTATKNENVRIKSMVAVVKNDFDLKQFWEIEEVNVRRTLTSDEERCEQLFLKNYVRRPDGRFVVRLPFTENHDHHTGLGQSKSIAMSRLFQLENRFRKNPSTAETYKKVLNEYLQLGHMIPVDNIHPSQSATSSEKYNARQCYLPHHAVIKESSTTTKVRVVFDASRPTQSGKSLNECMLIGPRLQQDLFDIVLRWRKHKIAICGDIEKMYRQIYVHDDDSYYQKIVWRQNCQDPIVDYRLLTVTFGTSSAPYLAIKTIHQLAVDGESEYPLAATVLKNDFYVDDMLSGADTINEAINLQNQVKSLLISAGFEMKKWSSNCSTVLENVPIEHRETRLPFRFDHDDTVKTLGLYWCPSEDKFKFKICLQPLKEDLTKRSILSDVAKVFDPIGWLAPVTIKAKIFLQQLWLTGLGWDDKLPAQLINDWLKYRNGLPIIERVAIPRWLGTFRQHSIQLHCFCDASIQAYAAVVYLRIEDDRNNVSTQLLTAKTKVAPTKTVSLPRLELCGAVLGSKLMHRMISSMNFEHISLYAWTDSTIVLSWLNGAPNLWKTFVANRVVEILAKTPAETWSHVRSADNPADCASRGINPEELMDHQLWWQGPRWLVESEESWPKIQSEKINELITDERKSATMIVTVSLPFESLLGNCSSLTKLLRSTAYCFRFIHNIRHPQNKLDGWLSSTETNASLKFWMKEAQRKVFSADIKRIEKGDEVNSKNKLTNLTPFLDANCLLRVGGRLENSELSFDRKHPIILPQHDRLTELIVDDMHIRTLHGGCQVMLAQLRRRYWIINARNLIRYRTHKCLICFKQRANNATQLMGQLPAPRIRTTRPFTHTGVDYAGPLEIKINKGRGGRTTKGYIAVFVCMAVKAIHLEAVTDLTTAAFLAAFRRFTSRRGLCEAIYSDCGTNFVGAAKVLRHDLNLIKIEKEAAENLAINGVKWHFNPPGAPHHGGLWEAGVKSTKNHLKRVLGTATLTFEELSTVLTQIEAVLNSRPLHPMTNDPNDLETLTPGHFLVGEALLTVPEPNYIDVNEHRLTRWQRMQQIQQSFWKRWHVEYLHHIQQTQKWNHRQPNVKIDDMVIIKNDQLPPTRWLLGRIVAVTCGKDGLIRVVKIRTKNGEIDRPITKICVLPNNAPQQ